MYDVATSILQQKLSQIDGVGLVYVGGGSLPAVRVDLNPTALNKYGIGLGEVRQVLSRTNVNRPKGQLSDATRTWEIRVNDQLQKAEDYLPLIVSYREGRAVRLSDIATVEHSVEDVRTTGLANGIPAVLIVINRQPGANIIRDRRSRPGSTASTGSLDPRQHETRRGGGPHTGDPSVSA